MYQLRGEQEAIAGLERGRGGEKYISLVFPILKFRSIHFLSSPRLRELFALWDSARRRILSDRHFGEWQKRGKVRNVENWQIGERNSRERKKKEDKKGEASKEEKAVAEESERMVKFEM